MRLSGAIDNLPGMQPAAEQNLAQLVGTFWKGQLGLQSVSLSAADLEPDRTSSLMGGHTMTMTTLDGDVAELDLRQFSKSCTLE